MHFVTCRRCEYKIQDLPTRAVVRFVFASGTLDMPMHLRCAIEYVSDLRLAWYGTLSAASPFVAPPSDPSCNVCRQFRPGDTVTTFLTQFYIVRDEQEREPITHVVNAHADCEASVARSIKQRAAIETDRSTVYGA